MSSRIPRQSARESGRNHPDIEAGLSAELASVVSGARRRALRDGDRQIDTAHLLHSLLESDPEVRAVFDGGAQVARLLGYLVQRSIGYGLRWQSTVEDFGAGPVVVDAGWSPVAAGAMEEAYARAVLRGDERARGVRARQLLFNSTRPLNATFDILHQQGVGLLVFGPERRALGRWRFRRACRKLREQAPCLVWTNE